MADDMLQTLTEDQIAWVVQEVAELPDRTSPLNNLDYMLVTGEELATILRQLTHRSY